MAEIIVSGIEKSFVQDRVVLDDVSFQVDAGERVGLLGPNGAGKTTLLKIITGEITPDKGFIAIPQGRRVGYISQLAEAPEGALVEDVLRMAFAEVQAVSTEIEQIQCQMDAGEHSEALLRRSIYAVMPKRQAQQLEAITARLGPVPVSRIEQIRREIMGIARELEEAGEIQLQLFAEQTAE